MKEKLSIVIPCFHSEKSLPLLIEAVIAEKSLLDSYDVEIIMVNDGSGSATWAAIAGLTERYPFCRGIDLAKNSGQHNAILAGMACAHGDYIVGMDDDLQTHPRDIALLLDKLKDGYDIVYGRFVRRHHAHARNTCSRLCALSARWLLDKPKDLTACPMYAIRAFVRDEVIRGQSAYTNLLGLFLRTSDRIANVEISHYDRVFGASGYTPRKLLRLWSSYLNYSMKPLRMLFVTGGAAVLLGLLALPFVRAGNARLMAWELLLAGILLLGMGMMGEYVGRMFAIISKEPQYVVRADTEGRKNSDSGRGKRAD